MSTQIHPSAVVSPKAQLGTNVRIGAFAVIDDDVIIGDDTEIMVHGVILAGSRLGKSVLVYPGAVIGAAPQDLRFHGQHTEVFIGDRTTLRECVTVNRASHTDAVRVGSDCLIMAYTHIAHDCQVGNNVVIANATQLGGHVEVGDWAILGGVSKVHQFCRIGKHVMVAADAMITKDVAPFVLTGRSPVKVEGINKVGLSRRGFSQETVASIDEFVNTVFFSGKNMSDGIATYRALYPTPIAEVEDMITFIETSKRGVYR